MSPDTVFYTAPYLHEGMKSMQAEPGWPAQCLHFLKQMTEYRRRHQ